MLLLRAGAYILFPLYKTMNNYDYCSLLKCYCAIHNLPPILAPAAGGHGQRQEAITRESMHQEMIGTQEYAK